MKNYKVYVIRDRQDCVKYAGLTSQNLRQRFIQHCHHKKLESEKFIIELVQEYLTLQEAVMLEEMLITQYRLRETGWNVAAKSINGYSNLHPEHLKAKWSKERKDKPVSAAHAAKNRIARLGKSNSEVHNQIIAEAKAKPIICLETGIIYKSAKQAAKELGLQRSKISNVCHDKRPTTGGLHFKFYLKR